ncbi:MAG: MFS transporter [Nostoc sp. S4]|nr:MFS transporter [Nostoc sp. S4]
MDFVQVEISAPLNLEIAQVTTPQIAVSQTSRIPKDDIRRSLRASTVDSVLAAVYAIGTSGILLGNLLVELDASPVIFGMLSSIPMLVNVIQPLGAYMSESSTSRFQYALRTHGIARLLWLILVIAIAGVSWGVLNSEQLVILTLLVLLLSHLLAGLGAASWLSWLAMIVPRQLRGRYFGIRNSAASLTSLICVPIAGLAISHWYGGVIQGYGIVLLLSMIFGLVGLGCQYFQVDMNPRSQNTYVGKLPQTNEIQPEVTENEHFISVSELDCQPYIPTPQNELANSIWKNSNFLRFIVYLSLWTLAVNLSSPFFNLYMLDTLDLDVSYVTIYNSLQAGANLLMLILWGKLADKIGNRLILIYIGILVAATPLLWLGIGFNHLNVWLWLPLLHILGGGTWAAIDLCSNNIQLAIAPTKNQSIYFATAAAVAGVSGALGITIGSLIVQFTQSGGLLGLFAFSSLFRLTALVPLMFIQEPDRG